MHRRELIWRLSSFAVVGGIYGDKVVQSGSSVNRESFAYQAESDQPKEVAGVRLVDSDVAKRATQLTRSVSPPYLFNHAVRTFILGSLVGRALGQDFDDEVLYLASILHDLGLTTQFEGDLPFEIQGAQAAKHFLEEQRYEAARTGVVWDGIAMHASVIGQFKKPEVALVGAGAGADVVGPDFSQVSKSKLHEILTVYPRLGFREAFIKTCSDVVRRHPMGAGHSFMRDIGERYVPGYRVHNFCDAMAKAPFAD